MIVYVESNFVLELAREQEELQSALEILKLAQTNRLNLKIPVFALAEPFWTLSKDEKERKQFYESLAKQSSQLKRTKKHQDLHLNTERVLVGIRAISRTETADLKAVIDQLFNTTQVIELNKGILERALQYQEQYAFENVQDAIVYSTIISDCQAQGTAETKCFVSRDKQAFGSKNVHRQEIKAELAGYNCQLKLSFGDMLRFVQGNPSQP